MLNPFGLKQNRHHRDEQREGVYDHWEPRLERHSLVDVLNDSEAEGQKEAFGYHRPWKYLDNPYKKGPWAKTMRTNRYRFTLWTTGIESGELL